MRQVLGIYAAPETHWVGDGFPVRTMLSHHHQGRTISPFILLDYAGPVSFEPTSVRRGVDRHPHKGFETVTIVYSGEVEHRDSSGAGGVIGPGDVQWMTAGAGILHEEFHSAAFARSGGPFEMVQLWVNLRAEDKAVRAGYQAIRACEIPEVELADGAGRVRVIAGSFQAEAQGPARTFTPMNVWDMRLSPGGKVALDIPDGHTASILVLSGAVRLDGRMTLRDAQTAVLARTGGPVGIESDSESKLLVLSGAPIDEPVVAQGPFVMNTAEEVRQAMRDFKSGHFGVIAEIAPA